MSMRKFIPNNNEKLRQKKQVSLKDVEKTKG